MRSSFKIPLQTEVFKHIKEKMGWPDDFCRYYADKFWSHYQASGWKLSSGNSVKDWKACFNAQWKVPKYKEDIEKLYGSAKPVAHTSVKPPSPVPTNEIERLDQFLQKYVSRPTDIPFAEFGEWYPYMKAEKLLKPMYPKEIEELRATYHGDNSKCRCAAVQITMDGYVKGGITFADIFKMRLKLTV